MKYIVAIVVCLVEILLYIAIGAALRWQSAGGVFPMLILFTVVGATWTGVTKYQSSASDADEK